MSGYFIHRMRQLGYLNEHSPDFGEMSNVRESEFDFYCSSYKCCGRKYRVKKHRGKTYSSRCHDCGSTIFSKRVYIAGRD